MSILSIDDYKLVQEEALEYSDITERAFKLLVDVGWDAGLARAFADRLEECLDDADSVSFISAYKNYIIPKNFAAVALVKWTTPEKYTDYLAPSDFCAPVFIAQQATPEFLSATEVLEEFMRVEAEGRQYSYELRESLNL